jgi:putative lipoprotein (rSAM/lipoprotein system)
MKKILTTYLPLLALLLSAASCVPGNFDDINPDETLMISGLVLDEDGMPLEHIKVSLDWNHGKYQVVKYTSSDGRFETPIEDLSHSGTMNLTITLDDIDGEQNNGSFKSHTETLTFIRSEIEDSMIFLEYRLNHATASENSPLS